MAISSVRFSGFYVNPLTGDGVVTENARASQEGLKEDRAKKLIIRVRANETFNSSDWPPISQSDRNPSRKYPLTGSIITDCPHYMGSHKVNFATTGDIDFFKRDVANDTNAMALLPEEKKNIQKWITNVLRPYEKMAESNPPRVFTPMSGESRIIRDLSF
jgi:hypothetical protein